MQFLPETVPAVLEAARRYGNARVVCVDNGSTDGSREWLHARPAGVVNVLDAPACSIAAARNLGAASLAGVDGFVFLDADCLVSPDYLQSIGRTLGGDTQVTGSTYALPDSPSRVEAVWDGLHARPADGRAVDWLNGGNLVVSREAFGRVGGFAEDIVTGEDVELCRRLRRAGYPIREEPAIRAIHLGNPTTPLAFYRKHVWHALGMFDTRHGVGLDRLSVLAMVHLVLIVGAVSLLIAGIGSMWVTVVVALTLPWVVPAAAVGLRILQGGRIIHPAWAIVLYQIYFLARLRAMARLLRLRFAGRPGAELHRDLRR